LQQYRSFFNSSRLKNHQPEHLIWLWSCCWINSISLTLLALKPLLKMLYVVNTHRLYKGYTKIFHHNSDFTSSRYKLSKIINFSVTFVGLTFNKLRFNTEMNFKLFPMNISVSRLKIEYQTYYSNVSPYYIQKHLNLNV
jgi:hypothetical protein